MHFRTTFIPGLIISCAALLIPLCVLERAAAQNRVTNPGFETGDFTGWTLTPPNSPDTVVGTTNPHTGIYYADGSKIGSFDSLSQNITTVAGKSYNLSFWLADNAIDGGPVEEIQVFWNGTLVLDRTDTTTFFSYMQITLRNLLATTSSTPLEFRIRNDPGFYYLDDVFVNILGIVSITVTPSGVKVKCIGDPGESYILQAAADPGGPYTDLPGSINAGVDGSFEFNDTTQPQPTRQFYRVRTNP